MTDGVRYGLKAKSGHVVKVFTKDKKSGSGKKRVFSNGAHVKKGMKTYSTKSKAMKACKAQM